MSLAKEFTKGLWKDLPPFRLVLGLCPTLAVTKSAETGLGMGLAVIFVLTCSNILVSLLRNIIPRIIATITSLRLRNAPSEGSIRFIPAQNSHKATTELRVKDMSQSHPIGFIRNSFL